jgi:hypothetical protein
MQNFYSDIYQLVIGSSRDFPVYVMLPVWLYLLVAVSIAVALPRR